MKGFLMKTGPFALIAATLLLASPFALFAQSPNPVPTTKVRDIYPQSAQAKARVQKAMQLAKQQHKRVILNFGTDQCADCQVLEKYLHADVNQAQIDKYYLVVNVDIGKKHNLNLDIASRYGFSLDNGIPALAVIDGSGHVIHAPTKGEFTRARYMNEGDVTEFLNRWHG